MTDQPKPDRQNGDAISALIDLVSRSRSHEIDLELREKIVEGLLAISAAPARDAAEGARQPVARDTERFARLSDEPLASIPDGYIAPLDNRTTRELIHDRTKAAPPKPAPDAMRVFRELIAAMENPDLQSFDDEKSADARDSLAEAKLAAKSALSAPVPPADGATAQDLWQELVEKTDRTSPEEYPEMALITFEELRDFVGRALSPPPAGAAEPVAWRWRPKGTIGFTIGFDKPENYPEAEPLYAAPPVRGDREAIVQILKSQIRTSSPADDVEASVTNAEQVADAILSSVQPGAGERLKLGDIVRANETFPHFHEWRNAEMKIVSMRIDPEGNQWVSVIEGSPRHRGNGAYDSETTDIKADWLSRQAPHSSSEGGR